MNIIQVFEDPRLFGSLIKDQSTFKTWKVILKVLFCIPLDDAEIATFQKLTKLHVPPTSRPKECWIIAGRRSGKTLISALIACFLALFGDWTKYLSPGEYGHVLLLAVDRRQAGELFRRVLAVFRLPLFRNRVEKETADEIWLTGGIIITVATSDFRLIRGRTVLAAILDECAYFRSEGANPLKELLIGLRPAMATIPESLLIGISSPYAKSGPLWEIFRDKYAKADGEILVIQAETAFLNPTIRQSVIDSAMADDPDSAKAEWYAQFRSDLENFVDSRALEAVTVRDRFELPPVLGIAYKGFADAAGGSGADSFTGGVAHLDKNGVAVLDYLREVKPRFKPVDVVSQFAEVFKSFGVKSITADRYAGEWVVSAFSDVGISVKPSPWNKSEIYLEALPMIMQGRVELLDNQALFNQMRSLERRVRSGGKDIVDHPTGLHDDLANSACGALVLASAGKSKRGFLAFSEESFYGNDSPSAWNSNHGRLLSELNEY